VCVCVSRALCVACVNECKHQKSLSTRATQTNKQNQKKKMPAILGSGYQCLLDSAVFVLICIVAHITSRTPLYASVQVFFFLFLLCVPPTLHVSRTPRFLPPSPSSRLHNTIKHDQRKTATVAFSFRARLQSHPQLSLPLLFDLRSAPFIVASDSP
jgi:hypothetical protein